MGKKKFKDTKFGKVLGSVGRVGKSVLLGATGGTLKPAIGAAMGFAEGFRSEIEDNKNSDNGGKGSIDWIRVASMVIFVGLVALLVFGKIDLDTFKELVDALEDQ